MDKKIIAAILLFAALALGIGILIPGGDIEQTQRLPWQIEPTPDGSIRVFGLTLGESTVQEAEQFLQAPAKLQLFKTPDQPVIAEVYFEDIRLNGLSARMVMQIDVPNRQLLTMYERGERISTLASGGRKVTLSDDDLQTVRRMPIISITYLPRVRLQADVIQQRFGEPVQRIREADSTTEHWLYPKLGLDIALDAQGNTVFQYVAPAEFARLRQPLQSLQM